jgi:hypothetical protein
MEPQKRARYSKPLELEEIEEILMDEESDEELEETDELMESRVQSSSSSEEEDDAEEKGITFRARRAGDSPNIFDFTGLPYGVNRSAAPDINAECSPFSVFIHFFRQIFQIIVDETNRYFHQCMASKNRGSTAAQPPDITIEEMYSFFVLLIQMGHDQRGSLKDYWSREEQYCIPFYSNVMARDRFLHILRFLHFENNEDPPNHDDPNYDRLLEDKKGF